LQQEHFHELPRPELTDDGIQQMLALAETLRAANGGELDEAAILAVSEATGAPVEVVRVAVRHRPEEKRRGVLHKVRSEYLGLDPEVRRNVIGGALGAVFALASVLSVFLINVSKYSTLGTPETLETLRQDSPFNGFLGVVQIICATLAVYLVSTAKDARSAAIAGAVTTGFGFIAGTIFQAIFAIKGISAGLIIPLTLLGAVGGMLANMIVSKNRRRLGLKDPAQERQELLKQLVDLQNRLKSGEQTVTFLSVDIVGSTRMKELADALSIEYTFNEYHQFVDRVARKYGGSIHSTAGDGMTCAFDTALQAFGAAKNIQAGLIELNTFGNQTGIPIALRIGIHSGTVLTPKPGDIGSLNFAHVIDVSAHLQKIAPVGGIVVSDAAAICLPGGAASVGTDRVEAQGINGFVWQPKALQTVPVGDGPPPLPG
jgi:class 3 adenylate cyclase